MKSSDLLERLDQVLQARKTASPDVSYTASLYAEGEHAIVAKILEEAKELAEAGCTDDRAHIVHEAADLWFHCQVLLAYKNISATAVVDELAQRFGVSGLEEKKNRQQSD